MTKQNGIHRGHLFQEGHAKMGGRQKGTPNKTTALLKDAILQAAMQAGGKDGIVGYLRVQALANPGPFMALLGKVLPMQLASDNDPTEITRIERVIVGVDGVEIGDGERRWKLPSSH